jgi:hypothetical protein
MCVDGNLSAVHIAATTADDNYFILPCVRPLLCSASDEEWRVEQRLQQTDGHPFCDKRIPPGLFFRFCEVTRSHLWLNFLFECDVSLALRG